MTTLSSCIYTGTVVHHRLAPKHHRFAYNVFSLCLDVDQIDRLDRKLKWFSRNRTNLVSFHDADFGAASSETVAAHARRILHQAQLDDSASHIMLLCYPRILGYVFNPLSVYFCYRDDHRLGAIIYEVSNTFAERKSYVIPVADGAAGLVEQACAKEMYVSPFTSASGRYAFRVRPPAGHVQVGVDFLSRDALVLATSFMGQRRDLNDRTLLGLLARYPLMTLKVIVAIHYEAARLFLKGVPVVDRFSSPKFSTTVVELSKREPANASK